MIAGRFKPPTAEQVQAYQRRRQERALVRAAPRSAQAARGLGRGRRARRRNDAPWYRECVAAHGDTCVVPGCGRPAQMDHLIARSQGGPSVVANGLPLCGDFDNGHHAAKTAGVLKIRYEWLSPTHREWLSHNGHATWLPDGTVAGRHRRQFAPRTTEERTTS